MSKHIKTIEQVDHPELTDTCWTWRRKLAFPRSIYDELLILCCPEDVICEQAHSPEILCESCCFPLCYSCFFTSKKKEDHLIPIPEALTNDNFWGYATALLYKYKVRWIEAAAACPIFTALILIFLLNIIFTNLFFLVPRYLNYKIDILFLRCFYVMKISWYNVFNSFTSKTLIVHLSP